MNIKDLIKRGENDSDEMEAKHPANDSQHSDQRIAYLGEKIWMITILANSSSNSGS